MKSLFKNCLHSNDIFLVEKVNSYGIPIAIIKSSSSINGIKSLHNELSGIKWYNNIMNYNILNLSIEIETTHYLRTKCDYVEGVAPMYYAGFNSNKHYIKSIVDLYCVLWPKSKNINNRFAIHGDFSIVNFLFKCDGNPVILDWEHFTLNIGPLGFDALNFLFEQIWLEKENNNDLFEIVDEISYFYKTLKENKAIDEKYFSKSPLLSTVNFIKQNKNIWGLQVNKLPVLKFSKKEIKDIDDFLCEA